MNREEMNKKWINHINKERIKILYKDMDTINVEKIITILKKIIITNFGKVSEGKKISQYNLEYYHEGVFYDIYRMTSPISYDLSPTPYSNGGYWNFKMHEVPAFKGILTEKEGEELFLVLDRFAQENYHTLPHTLDFEEYNERTQEWFYDEVVKLLEKNYPHDEYRNGMGSEIAIKTEDAIITIPNHPYCDIEYTLIQNRKILFDTIVKLKTLKEKQRKLYEEPYIKIKKEIEKISKKLNQNE